MRIAARIALIAALLSSAVTWAAAPITLSVVTDRPNAMYKIGEDVRFLVSAKQGGNPITTGDFDYTLTLDGAAQFTAARGHLGEAPAEIEATLDAPGILRCTVSLKASDQQVSAMAGAAYEPEKIKPSAPEPKDFRAFWDQKKKLLAAIPMDAKLTEAPQFSSADAKVWKLSLANINGSRVYAWFGVPTKPGKHPAVLTVPWAGVYPTPVDWAAGWARRGFVAIGISAHDYDVDFPQAKYTELDNGAIKGWPYMGRESRETCYFLRMFLSCVRAIDYVASRPEWDGRHLIVNGSSQGGGLSLVAAGLDSRVTALAANVPALCDHLGYTKSRPSGWPGLVGGDPVVAKVAPYFDAVNFARYIKCPAIVGVGLIDGTCPATTVYAAYNVLQGRKKIVVSPLMGHAMSQEYGELMNRWIPREAGE